MGLRPTGCSSMLHRRQIVHLVNRFYHTLESHKARHWILDPHLTVTFYLCWYSVLFILKGAVISMMCFKSLLNIVFYFVPFLRGQVDATQWDFVDKQPLWSQEITFLFHLSHCWCDFSNRIMLVSTPCLGKCQHIFNASSHISISLSVTSLHFPFPHPTLFLNVQRKSNFRWSEFGRRLGGMEPFPISSSTNGNLLSVWKLCVPFLL